MVIKGGWQPGNKDAEKAEEFAFSPRPEPLGADIVFFETVRSGHRPLANQDGADN